MKRFYYFIKKAFQNLRNFFFINLITVGIISLSLLVLSTFFMVFLNLQTYLNKWKDQIQVSVYLADNNKPEDISLIQKKINSFPQVKKVSLITKEEALSFFKDSFPGQKKALESLKDNPLPASMDIQLQDEYRGPDEVKFFALQIKKIPGVEDVEYGQTWIEGYANFLRFMRSAALAVGIVILLATIFIISNTIKLTLFARKDEIEIMKLVGATNFFIKIPFFLEGILQGLLGAFFALIVLFFSYQLFSNWIAQSSYFSLKFFKIFFLPLPHLLLITAVGMITGFLGSFFSLGRYLKYE
ncbi:MAG: cell division protein FtsX [Deltaproteobacteria bacterium]|nr:cell division protein FtsX [Deltaproteobacteria bacterium]